MTSSKAICYLIKAISITNPEIKFYFNFVLQIEITVCPSHHFGLNCMQLCECQNGADCDPLNGSCKCLTGWSGEKCDVSCPEGYYGINCKERCNCDQGVQCDPIDGECICPPGYHGKNCDLCRFFLHFNFE